MEEARRQTTELLSRYNDYVSSELCNDRHTLLSGQTNALSDLFLDIHRRLEEMEEAVGRAERRKRKELAERY